MEIKEGQHGSWTDTADKRRVLGATHIVFAYLSIDDTITISR